MDGAKQRDGSSRSGDGEKKDFSVAAPAISLPKGGGAIRGIGEKFGANPVTGTGSMSVPIYTSPGRGGFGPKLALSYGSGAGNGPFGFGWSLSLPSITRKTDKGLPRYRDADESDVFLLSGAEDLVPELTNGKIVETTREGYQVRRYRPRIEGLFARIERWTKPGDTYWRSISRDNVTTLYGRTEESRIFDPADPTHIFGWLICESHDDKGNAIVHTYVPEDSEGIDQFLPHEQNRSRRAKSRTAGRYLKRIQYGNRVSRLAPAASSAAPGPALPKWLFEIVFDYGEARAAPGAHEGHWESIPAPTGSHEVIRASASAGSGIWPARPDTFSSYRAGFEVRTYRRCQRVLMFHHFPELSADPYLVRSTEFDYADLDYSVVPAVETELAHKGSTRLASFLRKVTQRGHLRHTVQPAGAHGADYLTKALPPIELDYSQAVIRDDIREVDAESLENLPAGLSGAQYQWVDLDGEGLSGVLTEQGGAWFYKRNVSIQRAATGTDGPMAEARFGPIELLGTQPCPANLAGGQQLLDLAGDGQLDVVQFEGALPGYFERTTDFGWETFTPFVSLPNVAFGDPNLKFVDLTGDGHADLLITDDGVFTWYPSLGEQGFGPGERVHQPFDEEDGPHVVFGGGTQSIYLADMSGDGLSDIVRIRNGEVCYWPNLGYGRFGAKITMDHSPWFDAPDLFDPRRIRIADIDGSGTSDILYLNSDSVDLYFNRSGNSFSAARKLTQFPRIDNLSSVTVADLLGNGTACLVWSSALAGDASRPMRYIDLIGGQKPHLLVSLKNNLGAETSIEYAPSTKFYLADKRAGKPWITRLPFPVHCVERVTVRDVWRDTKFSTTYSYHHGYFDGVEREFRGFGRVEQVDVESFGKFARDNQVSAHIATDTTLYQPPVKTITWYHTGAFLDRERILSHYQAEYFPNSLASLPNPVSIDGIFTEKPLPEPDLSAEDLTADEWREALRACKGMTLRQEVYELSVAALEESHEIPVRLFSAATHNSAIRRLQAKGDNRHAVFLLTESEAVSYHYELDFGLPLPLAPDPRIAHTLNLSFDDFGNVQQSIAVGYERVRQYQDSSLDAQPLALVREVQREHHRAYTETHYTKDPIDSDAAPQPAPSSYYRLPQPYEVQTYELTGISPATGRYFELAELRKLALSTSYLPVGTARQVKRLDYHELPPDLTPHMRLVEHARTLFFKDDLTDHLALGTLGRLGLPYQQYKLALTEDLLKAVFTSTRLNAPTPSGSGGANVHSTLRNPLASGYVSGAHFFPPPATPSVADEYWIRSGIAGFAADAAEHFYLPERYTDAFDHTTVLEYDSTKYDLFVQSSTDPLGNTTRVVDFDYRVLAASELEDCNLNRSEAWFDVLGRVIALAIKGKVAASGTTQADSLDGYDDVLANPTLLDVLTHFELPPLNAVQARNRFSPTLGNATARYLYHFGEKLDANGKVVWGARPSGACAIVREQHVADVKARRVLEPTAESPLQVAFECSDGSGAVLMKRSQAEPEPEQQNTDPPLRWIVSGKTVLNNKGKPVKQYEPYFSENPSCCAEGDEHEEVGVTPLMYYDAAGRLVRTELPDGTFSRVEFSPWHVLSFDANDTVRQSRWYAERNPPDPTQPLPVDALTQQPTVNAEERAAWLAAQHNSTPALTILDSLGREVIGIAHNKYTDSNGTPRDEKYLTFTKLDAEGKPLWICDARGNLVMQYITPPKPNHTALYDQPTPAYVSAYQVPVKTVPCYDIAGNLLFQRSMDAGDRFTLNDAAGKPMFAWDLNERQNGTAFNGEQRLYSTKYDALHRPTRQSLSINSAAAAVIERFEYLDTNQPGSFTLVAAQDLNLCGQLYRHYDPSGLLQVDRIGFNGSPLRVRRRLAKGYDFQVIDWQGNPDPKLEPDTETFVQITEYDALKRMSRLYNWHRPATTPTRVAVYEPLYNARGLLRSENVVLRATKTATAYDTPGSTRTTVIEAIHYDAKGQREAIFYGNDSRTRFSYDPKTFRLVQLRTTRPNFDPKFPSATSDFTDLRIVQNLFYTYDAVGNITEIYDDAYEPAFFAQQAVEARSLYTYDALYRLIHATGRERFDANAAPRQAESAPLTNAFAVPTTSTSPNPKALRNYRQRYQYDRVGNISSMRHWAGSERWTRSYAYATDSNRLAQTALGPDALDATNPTVYRHDTHGNLLNLANVGAAQYMRWDHRDMIHTLDRIGGGIMHYQYDAGKQRTRKVSTQNGSKAWERIYLGGMELYRRYDGTGKVVEETESHHVFEGEHRVLLIEDVLKTNKPGATTGALYRYQYGNHLGSACLELDDTAKLITYEEYHPYGTSAYRTARNQVEAAKRYRYTGMERDEESGLSYHLNRYLVPWLARWASGDPAQISDGVNVFGVVGGNPTNLVDAAGTNGTKPGHNAALKGELNFVAPELAKVDPKGTVSEFQIRYTYTDASTGKEHVRRLRIDAALPPDGMITEPIFRENKGKPRTGGKPSTQTAGQGPFFRDVKKGVWVDVTSRKPNTFGPKYQYGSRLFLKEGQNFFIADATNVALVQEGTGSVYGTSLKKAPTAWRMVAGKKVALAAETEAKVANNVKVPAAANGTVTAGKAVSPGSLGLGGLQEYGQTHDAAAVDATANSSKLAGGWSATFGVANDSLTGADAGTTSPQSARPVRLPVGPAPVQTIEEARARANQNNVNLRAKAAAAQY